MMSVDPSLLRKLCCPDCGGDLIEQDAALVCGNPQRPLSYPIRDGIPVLIVEQAKPCIPDAPGA